MHARTTTPITPGVLRLLQQLEIDEVSIRLQVRGDQINMESAIKALRAIHKKRWRRNTSLTKVKDESKTCVDTRKWIFRHDSTCAAVPFTLRQEEGCEVLRPYQRAAINSIIKKEHAVSGQLKLPCGAGKTLIGLDIMRKLGCRTLIVTPHYISCVQWVQKLNAYLDIDPAHVLVLGKENNVSLFEITQCLPSVVVITYTMLTSSQEHSAQSQRVLNFLKSIVYGLMILDEVQTAPAHCFQWVRKMYAKVIVGLSATLVREDDAIGKLNQIVGPLLFVAAVPKLVLYGYLKEVKRFVLYCPAATASSLPLNNNDTCLLELLNPYKLFAISRIAAYHMARGEKVILFCDEIEAMHFLHDFLVDITGVPALGPIFMDTPLSERLAAISAFKNAEGGRCILFSRVGDIAIDMPRASVVVQLGASNGSRNQEVQRIGRVQRTGGTAIGVAYTLLTMETKEVEFFRRRNDHMLMEGYDCTTCLYPFPELGMQCALSAKDADLVRSEYARFLSCTPLGSLLPKSAKRRRRSFESRAKIGSREVGSVSQSVNQVIP